MKNLTKASIEDLQRQMPVLDEETQRIIYGGNNDSSNGSDCVFYCIASLYSGMGGKFNCTAETVGNLYDQFEERVSGNSNGSDLGVKTEYLCGFLGLYYDYDTPSAMDLYRNFDDYQGSMAIVSGGQHAVTIIGIDTADVDRNFIYWDPQNKVSGVLRADEMTDIFGIKGFADGCM